MAQEPADTAEPSGQEHPPESTQATAYQQLMQSVATTVADTGEQLRLLATLSTAASGVALRLMLEGEQPQNAAQAMEQAQQSLQKATAAFQEIGRVSVQLLERFQPPAARSPPAAKPPIHEEKDPAS